MGAIYKQKESKNYWIKFYQEGQPKRESVGSDSITEARKLLKLREGQAIEGKVPDLKIQKTTIGKLADLYERDYTSHGRKTVKEAKRYVVLVKAEFGGLRAASLTSEHLMNYRLKRQSEKVKDSTINRELSALRRMFHLGMKHDPPLVTRVPNIELVPEKNVRTGFFELADFQRLRDHLPDYLRALVSLGFHTGMRFGEIVGLRWTQIDFASGTLRLERSATKNGEAREVPLLPEVLTELEAWRLTTLEKWPACPWVCHLRGEQLQRITRSWKTACKKAGLSGRLFHDLRRSAVRSLVRAGVYPAIARQISGHRSDNVFERYNIIDRRDLADANAKLTAFIEQERQRIDAERKRMEAQNAVTS